jgi:hypothetical protein
MNHEKAAENIAQRYPLDRHPSDPDLSVYHFPLAAYVLQAHPNLFAIRH